MSRAVLAPFEAYQKARVTFVQTVAELAQRPQNIEALQSAGKLPFDLRLKGEGRLPWPGHRIQDELLVLKLKLFCLCRRRYGAAEAAAPRQRAVHLAVGRAGPRPPRQLLGRARRGRSLQRNPPAARVLPL